jgi:hypothetical protein
MLSLEVWFVTLSFHGALEFGGFIQGQLLELDLIII